ncbi:ubiquitin-conjugating enzyme family protein [Actinidia rufa]|uniref:Ubiquitin-conjugating enzyme family protein n=1 Tax=Actinidia rufa TaxID=165716 RepID=A0A7J0E225_9ERIC|nr:ubiquitin-conjugating enzyme family protein [Actinidia rufa]
MSSHRSVPFPCVRHAYGSRLRMSVLHSVYQRPEDNDRYVNNCRNGKSPKETRWWFHDDKV